MKEKTAIIFGATGLVGSYVLNYLLYDDRYEKIKIFTRKPLNINHSKIEETIIDILNFDSYSDKIKGDDLFCCIGTTRGKAGSKENFKKIDFLVPVKIAEIAYNNGVDNFIVISSIGANHKSKIFYLKVKGMMEEEVKKFKFKKLFILRPSMLLGKRNEFRLLEEIGKILMRLFGFLMVKQFKKYKGIKASTVARCMINLANCTTGKTVIESDEIVLHAGRG